MDDIERQAQHFLDSINYVSNAADARERLVFLLRDVRSKAIVECANVCQDNDLRMAEALLRNSPLLHGAAPKRSEPR